MRTLCWECGASWFDRAVAAVERSGEEERKSQLEKVYALVEEADSIKLSGTLREILSAASRRRSIYEQALKIVSEDKRALDRDGAKRKEINRRLAVAQESEWRAGVECHLFEAASTEIAGKPRQVLAAFHRRRALHRDAIELLRSHSAALDPEGIERKRVEALETADRQRLREMLVGAQHATLRVGGSPRSLLIGYVIWLLVPVCTFGVVHGAHRFYARKYVTGAIWFATFGVLLVGWLLDMFRLPQLIREAVLKQGNEAMRKEGQSAPSLVLEVCDAARGGAADDRNEMRSP